MRICMLVKNSFEYDARVTKEARSLVRAGHEVVVVALHVAGLARAEQRDDGIRVVRIPRLYGRVATVAGPGTHVPGAVGSTSMQAALLRRVTRPALPAARGANAAWLNREFILAAAGLRPDVVHAHDLNTLVPGVIAARRSGARLVYDSHELATERNEKGEFHRLLTRRQQAWGIGSADAVITATDRWAEYLVGVHGIARPAVVRNVPERSKHSLPAGSLRRLAEVPDGQPIVLYQGSIQANRGIEQAIDSLQFLSRGVLVVLGFGALRQSLEQQVARAGLGDRVRFPGPVGNDVLIGYAAQADVGLCTIVNSSLSYYWSLPNKLYEYMHAGIAQVTSDFPEMGEVVRRTGAGEVCDPANPRAVARAIERILANPAPYRERAREAADIHHWGREEQTLLGLYQRLPGARPPDSATQRASA